MRKLHFWGASPALLKTCLPALSLNEFKCLLLCFSISSVGSMDLFPMQVHADQSAGHHAVLECLMEVRNKPLEKVYSKKVMQNIYII